MPGPSSQGIFLSYRREDAGAYARLLKSELSGRFPAERVFMDLDSIEGGLDFAEVIADAVGSCAVLVALIGRQWATITDEEGRRRLDDPHDYVRFEVQAALERGVRVLPVLVDGARPLRQQQLPSELGKLARLNALELSYGRYQYDAERLLDLIQRVLAAAPATSTVGPSRSTSGTAGAATANAGTAQPDEKTRDQAARKAPEHAHGFPGRADARAIRRNLYFWISGAFLLVMIAGIVALPLVHKNQLTGSFIVVGAAGAFIAFGLGVWSGHARRLFPDFLHASSFSGQTASANEAYAWNATIQGGVLDSGVTCWSVLAPGQPPDRRDYVLTKITVQSGA